MIGCLAHKSPWYWPRAQYPAQKSEIKHNAVAQGWYMTRDTVGAFHLPSAYYQTPWPLWHCEIEIKLYQGLCQRQQTALMFQFISGINKMRSFFSVSREVTGPFSGEKWYRGKIGERWNCWWRKKRERRMEGSSFSPNGSESSKLFFSHIILQSLLCLLVSYR